MVDLVIAIHATSAVIALLAAAVALTLGHLRRTHLAAVAVMVVTLVPALLLDWNETDPTLRWVFIGLIGLGGVMIFFAVKAIRTPLVAGRADAPHVEALGFNIIALLDGFGIIAALRADWPGWAVFAIGAGVIALGHIGIRIGRAAAERRATSLRAEPARTATVAGAAR